MKKIIPIFAIISIIFAFSAPFCVLQTNAGGFLDLNEQEGFEGGEISEAFGDDYTQIDVRYFMSNIIKAFLGLLGIIFLVLLVIAGYKYMMAQGNEDQVTEAKKQITQAIIGLVIVMSAYAITVFIIELTIKGSDDFWIF